MRHQRRIRTRIRQKCERGGQSTCSAITFGRSGRLLSFVPPYRTFMVLNRRACSGGCGTNSKCIIPFSPKLHSSPPSPSFFFLGSLVSHSCVFALCFVFNIVWVIRILRAVYHPHSPSFTSTTHAAFCGMLTTSVVFTPPRISNEPFPAQTRRATWGSPTRANAPTG